MIIFYAFFFIIFVELSLLNLFQQRFFVKDVDFTRSQFKIDERRGIKVYKKREKKEKK